jgi:hypothetical protein
MLRRITAILLLVPASVLAEEAVSQSIGHGQVDWTNKTVTATGSGAPSLKAANAAVARLGAERAAKLDAYRNVLETVRGLRLSGKTTAGAAADAAPELKSRLEGVIQGFKVLDTKYFSDGGVDVIIQGPIDGVLAETLAGPGGHVGTGMPDDGTTAVIIDAKGLGMTPAIAPRLLDEQGNEVYTASMVSTEALRAHGATGYEKSVDAAKKDPRAGKKPVVFKAARCFEPGSSDLVLSAADAERLRKWGGLLASGAVIIVID